jgi:hypothetical protein
MPIDFYYVLLQYTSRFARKLEFIFPKESSATQEEHSQFPSQELYSASATKGCLGKVSSRTFPRRPLASSFNFPMSATLP